MPAEQSTKVTRRSLRIGPYSVEAPLALGSLGSAYRATDLSAGRTVALKVLPPELAGSVARDRFQREAKKAAKVRSPNLANVLDFGDASGTWYLALELAEGPTLTEHVNSRGRLDAAAGQDLLVQAARALALLHREGLVPRDLSADNFRVTRGPDTNGRITVKLLDIGLLRPANDESPADVRAALAALGATVWFALSGRSGGKPDLGSLAGDVSDELRVALRRLLAQRPEERYPTPAALLEGLGEEEPAGTEDPAAAPPAAPLAALPAGAGQDEPPRKQPAATKKAPRRRDDPPEEVEDSPPPRRGRDEETEKETDDEAGSPGSRRPPGAGSRKALIWGGAAFGAVLLIGIVVLVMALMQPDNTPRPKSPGGGVAGGSGTPTDPVETGKEKPADPKATGKEKPPEQPAGPPPVPWLYATKESIDFDKVAKEYEGPWSAPLQPAQDAVVFRVARVPPSDGKPGTTFDSIAAACAAVPEGKWGVIKVEDDGPLFEGPIRISGRHVNIEGAKGFAPLIVWDVNQGRAELKPGKPEAAPPADDVPALFTVDKGTLLLGHVHLVVEWPEKAAGTGALVRAIGSDFVAWESTFSVAGKPHGALTAVRFEGGAGKRCRLKQCYARGARLTSLELTAPGADVLIETSLLVSTEAPVLSVAGGKGPDASTLRVVRSTLVGRDTLLRVRPSPDASAEPSLHWMGWDALLWRAGGGAGGTMVDLPKEAGAKAMTWRSLNCLYAGWETLLSGREPLAGGNTDGWHTQWGLSEGDVSLPPAWVPGVPADPSEAPPWLYRTDRAAEPSPVHFRATSNPGPLGCDLWKMPWVRARWLDLTTQPTRPTDIEVLEPDAALAIPEAADLLYHGERLDLDKIDLGAHLRDVQKRQKLAPLVVLHLHGSGKHKMTPIRLENTSLFLYFEPPAEGAEPLVLEPDLSVAPEGNAVLEVTRGNLWMIGADIRCPDFKTALMPPYLIMVTRGNLFLSATRLQGPVAQPPSSYWGLVRVEGIGTSLRDWTSMCKLSINRSTLVTAKMAVHLACAGVRADLRQSLIVGTERAVAIQLAMPQKPVPGNPTPAGSPSEQHSLFGEAILNMQLTADHCTFAAKEAEFHVDDVPVRVDAQPYLWPVVADPVLVQTKDCAFLNPFADKDGKAAQAVLLSFSGVALQRGVLCWQGEGDVYDKRLYAYVTTVGKDGKPVRSEKPQGYAAWERLWGPADAKAILEVSPKRTLDPEKLQLDQLALTAQAGLKEKPGADVTKLLAPRKAK
ncbi:MAG TPA: serine/threonine-protein kinase [Gemmataceae bacterium]|nr:serine/threonine-protein kinase [Gemmataceae bacterium]